MILSKHLGLLQHSYDQWKGDYPSKLEWISEMIFDFTTYDEYKSQEFGHAALRVCRAISRKETFKFIENADNYNTYLLMVNMPFFRDKIEWGTSIRGAWWSPKIELRSCAFYKDGEQIPGGLIFTEGSWDDFIESLLEFVKEEFNE